MSFLKNSTGLVRFTCDEIPKDTDYREEYGEAMIHYSFLSIDEDSDEERSVGWVDLLHNEDIPLEENVFKGDFLAISMRIDSKKVPACALRSLYKKLLAERRQQDPYEKITKEIRQQVRDAAKSVLLKKIIPTTKVYDVIWNLKKNSVWFSGTSEKLIDQFVLLFKDTFQLTLTALFPFNLAEQITAEFEFDLLNLTATSFT